METFGDPPLAAVNVCCCWLTPAPSLENCPGWWESSYPEGSLPTHTQEAAIANDGRIQSRKGQAAYLQQGPLWGVIYAPELPVNQANDWLYSRTHHLGGSFHTLSCFSLPLTGFSWELSLNTSLAPKSLPLTPLLRNPSYDINPLEFTLFLGCHEAQN